MSRSRRGSEERERGPTSRRATGAPSAAAALGWRVTAAVGRYDRGACPRLRLAIFLGSAGIVGVMLQVPLSLVARELEQVVIRLHIPPQQEGHLPRPRVHRRILERRFVLNRIRVDQCVALGDVKRWTGEVPGHIEPGLAVEVRRVDDERIAFPASD